MSLRNYEKSNDIVKTTYKNMHETQNILFVQNMMEKYKNFNLKKYNIWQLFQLLENINDESDPDTNQPQIIHSYQTAEFIKNNYLTSNLQLKNIKIKDIFTTHLWNKIPNHIQSIFNKHHSINNLYSHITDWSWFPLIGLIHDLGKILLLKEFGNLKQHHVVGDIYPIGCKFDETNIFYNEGYYKNNIDNKNSKYNSKYGIYTPNCGFDKLLMSWSHDYFLYKIILNSNHSLPKEALYIIRFHSFYPWHNLLGYQHLANDYDWLMLPLLKLFQKADLYSKIKDYPNFQEIQLLYQNLVNKFI